MLFPVGNCKTYPSICCSVLRPFTLFRRVLLLVLAGYLVDHELAETVAKASDDDVVGRSAFSKAAGS